MIAESNNKAKENENEGFMTFMKKYDDHYKVIGMVDISKIYISEHTEEELMNHQVNTTFNEKYEGYETEVKIYDNYFEEIIKVDVSKLDMDGNSEFEDYIVVFSPLLNTFSETESNLKELDTNRVK